MATWSNSESRDALKWHRITKEDIEKKLSTLVSFVQCQRCKKIIKLDPGMRLLKCPECGAEG